MYIFLQDFYSFNIPLIKKINLWCDFYTNKSDLTLKNEVIFFQFFLKYFSNDWFFIRQEWVWRFYTIKKDRPKYEFETVIFN
jgi:hypothetical protein